MPEDSSNDRGFPWCILRGESDSFSSSSSFFSKISLILWWYLATCSLYRGLLLYGRRSFNVLPVLDRQYEDTPSKSGLVNLSPLVVLEPCCPGPVLMHSCLVIMDKYWDYKKAFTCSCWKTLLCWGWDFCWPLLINIGSRNWWQALDTSLGSSLIGRIYKWTWITSNCTRTWSN